MTLGEVVRSKGGYTSGFDYLRLSLALLVVHGHSRLVTGSDIYHNIVINSISEIVTYSILPMFFSLSGFLVAASLLRVRNLRSFLALRVIRILPALFVEVLISALVIGVLLTRLPLREYFSSSEFFKYLLNIIGWPHYILPGVFESNPSYKVNLSLWTVPFEGECYIALAIIAFIGLVKKPVLFAALFIAGLFVLTGLAFVGHDILDTTFAREAFSGRQLVVCFMAGVTIYSCREFIPAATWIFISSIVVIILTVTVHRLAYISILPLAYVTVYVGLTTPRKLPLVFTGDYSYGIYLYASPIQQTAWALFQPNSSELLFVSTLPVIFGIAALSWHVVEKPFMKMKKFIIPREKRTIVHPQSTEMISPDKTDAEVANSSFAGREARPEPLLLPQTVKSR